MAADGAAVRQCTVRQKFQRNGQEHVTIFLQKIKKMMFWKLLIKIKLLKKTKLSNKVNARALVL